MGNHPSTSSFSHPLSAVLATHSWDQVVAGVENMRALKGGLSSSASLDDYLISFIDASRLREGIYSEGCVPLHCALSTPWTQPRGSKAPALLLTIAHTLFCAPTSPSQILTRYVTLIVWAVEAAASAKSIKTQTPTGTTAESVLLSIDVLSNLLISIATTLAALGKAGRIPDATEAYSLAASICLLVDPPLASNSRKTTTVSGGITAKAFALWALTPTGTHSLGSRWSLTHEAFTSADMRGVLPPLVAITTETEALVLSRALLSAVHEYEGHSGGAWESFLTLPGLRSALSAIVDAAGSQSETEEKAGIALRMRTSAAVTSMSSALEFAHSAGLTVSSIPSLRAAFAKAADASGQLNRNGFTQALKEAFPAFSDGASVRLFETFDTDGSGAISFSEFVLGIGSVARGSVGDKINALWTCFSDTGKIRPSDLLRFVKSGASTFANEAIDAKNAVTALFAAAIPISQTMTRSAFSGIEKKTTTTQYQAPSRSLFATSAVNGSSFRSWLRATLARPALGILRRALLDATPWLLVSAGLKAPLNFDRAATLAGTCPDDALAAFDKTPLSYSNIDAFWSSQAAVSRDRGGSGGSGSGDIAHITLDGSIYLNHLRSSLGSIFALREATGTTPPLLPLALQNVWAALVQVSTELCGEHHAETLPQFLPTRDVLFALSLALARTDIDSATALHRFLDVKGDGAVRAPSVLAWMLSAQERTDATFAAAARVLASADTDGDGAVSEAELRAAVIADPSLFDAFSILLGGGRAGPAPRKKEIHSTPSLNVTAAPSPTAPALPITQNLLHGTPQHLKLSLPALKTPTISSPATAVSALAASTITYHNATVSPTPKSPSFSHTLSFFDMRPDVLLRDNFVLPPPSLPILDTSLFQNGSSSTSNSIFARRLALLKFSQSLQTDLSKNAKQKADDTVILREKFAIAGNVLSDVARRATNAKADAIAEIKRTKAIASRYIRGGSGGIAAVRALKVIPQGTAAGSDLSIHSSAREFGVYSRPQSAIGKMRDTEAESSVRPYFKKL